MEYDKKKKEKRKKKQAASGFPRQPRVCDVLLTLRQSDNKAGRNKHALWNKSQYSSKLLLSRHPIKSTMRKYIHNFADKGAKPTHLRILIKLAVLMI
jgi:hypothetical protein